jgi:hypothetical protein
MTAWRGAPKEVDLPRRFPLVQFPNRSLILAALAGAVARLAGRRPYAPVAESVSHLALLIWALQELFSGANWFRRLLGLGGGGLALSGLLESAGARRESASAR